MTVNDIIADQLTTMTPELYQEFCIGGCIPMCHLTFQPIKMGEKFKLSTLEVAVMKGSANYNKLESKEVMLAENSSVEKFKAIQKNRIYQENLRRKQGGGCFRVGGKIVIN